MKLIAIEDSTMSLPQVVDMAKNGPVILTRDGQPRATVRDLSKADAERAALANNPEFQAIIAASRESLRKRGGIPLDEVRKQLGLKTPPARRRKRR
jgi:hypothetical protein